MTQINPCETNDGRFVTRMKTLLRTTLIYKQAAQLPSMPVITQPFCEGQCSGWGQTTDAAHWLIIADGFEWSLEWDPSKKSWLHSYSDHTPWTDQRLSLYLWMRQHSASRLSLSIVLINCRLLQKESRLLQLKEIGWEIKNDYCCAIYILWWHMCQCPPLYECVYFIAS